MTQEWSTGGASPDHGARTSLDRPIAASWLAIRREADARARSLALPLVDRLAVHLSGGRAGDSGAVTVVDLGSGTGANAAWLAPRLQESLDSRRQHWVLVDHDAGLLAALDLGRGGRGEHAGIGIATCTRVVGTVTGLGDIVAGLPRPVVVTCSALLDLLSPADLDTLAGHVTSLADAALLSLSVTGDVRFDPGHPDDAVLQSAFDRHQQRASRATGGSLAGPVAAELAAAALERRGWQVHRTPTPWVLGSEHAPLLHRWSSERVDAALEVLAQEGEDCAAAAVRRWWGRRAGQIEDGLLSVRVDHLDLLALPVR